MIDHIGITASDYERSKAFYLHALAPATQKSGLGASPKPATGWCPVSSFGISMSSV